MRGKRSLLTLLVSVGILSTTWADSTIINTDFSGYADGDLAGQFGWTEVANTATNAFDVSSGVVSTDTTATNTAAVYLSGSAIGNAVKDEWTTVIDFSLNRTTGTWANATVFQVGLSSVSTNGLGNAASDLFVGIGPAWTKKDGKRTIQVKSSAGNLAALNSIEAGWDDDSGTPTDFQTDNLRLTAVIRKTSESGYYEMSATLENLSSGSNSVGTLMVVSKPDAYTSASEYLFQSGGNDNFYGQIDSLSTVLTNGVNVSELLPPVPSVVAGVGTVDLSWEPVVEADLYIVQRTAANAGAGGPYSVFSTSANTNYSDTAVVNGNIYHYLVTASNTTVAVSADSDPVPGIPDTLGVQVTGTFIDTTFTNTATYSNGDLATQDKWRANLNTLGNAFTVDTAGDGFANTEVAAANTNVAAVYWKDYSTNNIGAMWSGSLGLTLDASSVTTAEKVVGVTTQQVAVMTSSNKEILMWGLHNNAEGSGVEPAENDDNMLLSLWTTDAGGIKFGLNNRFANGASVLSLSYDQLGWDPTWQDESNLDPISTLSDLLQVDWSIRKTAQADIYNAELTVTVGPSNYTGNLTYSVGNKEGSANLWNSGNAYFTMAQQVISAAELINVNIDSVSVTHTNDSAVPVAAPYGLATGVPNPPNSIEVSWNGTGEETGGFDVWRSSTDTNEASFGVSPYTNLTAETFTDVGLEHKRTYIYKIKGKFPTGDSEFSNILAVRALEPPSSANPFEWGPVTDGITGTGTGGNLAWTAGASSNNIAVWSASGFDDTSVSEGNSVVPAGMVGGNYNTNSLPLLYGWGQLADNGTWGQARFRSGSPDYVRMKGTTRQSVLLYVVGAETDMTGGNYKFTIDGKSSRFAVRNNGQWYASQTTVGNGSVVIANTAAELWTPFAKPATGEAMLDLSGASYATVTLDKVDAVGILRDYALETGNNTMLKQITVENTQVSQTTVFEDDMWGLGIYNEDAAATNDYDGDGVDNISEWGLDGDAANPNNDGEQRVFSMVDGLGNFIFIHPARADWPGTGNPNYNVQADGNLVILPVFTNLTGHTVDAGTTWIFQNNAGNMVTNNDLISVTNTIPISGDEGFFKLKVTE